MAPIFNAAHNAASRRCVALDGDNRRGAARMAFGKDTMAKKKQPPALPEGVPARPRHRDRAKAAKARRKHTRIGDRRQQSIYRQLNAADDPTLAIMGGNLVENSLAIAIMSRLRPLSAADLNRIFDGEAAALGRFHAKIQIGYALNIYGRADHDELMAVKFIRNRFAHHLRTRSFNDPAVAKECAQLRSHLHYQFVDEIAPTPDALPPAKTNRDKYRHSIAGLTYTLDALSKKGRRPRGAMSYLLLSDTTFQAWLGKRGQPHPPPARTRD